MDKQTIQQIFETRLELASLIVGLDPIGPVEWEAFDLLVAAFRNTRRIKLDKLGQIPLPETPAPAAAPKEQLPLPDMAAVQAGEGSLNEKGPPALVKTADEQFEIIPSASEKWAEAVKTPGTRRRRK